jgi:hypothetical protein
MHGEFEAVAPYSGLSNPHNDGNKPLLVDRQEACQYMYDRRTVADYLLVTGGLLEGH